MGPTSQGDDFLTTHWSLVRSAAGSDVQAAQRAFGELCRTYWYPLYAFVRRKGVSVHDAEDVVQGFFQQVVHKHSLGQLDVQKGRFRSFLLAAVSNHLANVRAAQRARKRGDGQTPIEIDVASAEGRYALEAPGLDPSRTFERAWALELLSRVLAGLEAEYRASERGELFDVLKGELGGGESEAYARYAERLGSTEAAVKVAVHRLRKRYRHRLRSAIAETVDQESEIESEIADLFRALGN